MFEVLAEMKEPPESQVVEEPQDDTDSVTDDIDLTAFHESGLTQAYKTDPVLEEAMRAGWQKLEANIILIAHPDNRRLGTRYRLRPGSTLVVGRSPDAAISLPEVPSISRDHAQLEHLGGAVRVVDLGSTNGTYVNGRLLEGPAILKSGDRFQVASVHFKFLHEEDVEHAYHEAIHDLLMRDGLTEIFNKRKYEEEVEREVARAQRHRRPLCLILFDLDEFKHINDHFGHLCGDFVLKQVVGNAREILRSEQVFARVGGDEFAILTPETRLAGAHKLARKLRDRIASLSYRYCDFEISVTCSFGVAQLDGSMRSHDNLFEAADQALFESKRAGRNRVTYRAPGGGMSLEEEELSDPNPTLSAEEMELLIRIHEELPEEALSRLRELESRQRSEPLAREEKAELARLAAEAEELKARRIRALEELAELREISVEELYEELGLEPPTEED